MASPTRKDLEDLIAEVQLTLRDDPALNRLLDEDHPFESSPRHIAQAIKQVMYHINNRPPRLPRYQFSWYTFPDRYLLVLGVCAILQRSVADVDDRNYLPAQDGQTNMSNRSKGALVRRAGEVKWQEFLSGLDSFKFALNLESAMGGRGLASEAGEGFLDEYIHGTVGDYDGGLR